MGVEGKDEAEEEPLVAMLRDEKMKEILETLGEWHHHVELYCTSTKGRVVARKRLRGEGRRGRG